MKLRDLEDSDLEIPCPKGVSVLMRLIPCTSGACADLKLDAISARLSSLINPELTPLKPNDNLTISVLYAQDVTMVATSENTGAPPASATAAVMVESSGMPEGSQKVEELDFNQFAGKQITVDDLISGMNHMGFQASSIGESVRIINDMVTRTWLFCLPLCEN